MAMRKYGPTKPNKQISEKQALRLILILVRNRNDVVSARIRDIVSAALPKEPR